MGMANSTAAAQLAVAIDFKTRLQSQVCLQGQTLRIEGSATLISSKSRYVSTAAIRGFHMNSEGHIGLVTMADLVWSDE
jgi:hypothetical protein